MRHMNKDFFILLLLSFLASFATAKTLGTADTFAAAKLTQEEVSQLIPALEQLAYDTPDSWNTELRAKRIDLGSSPGLVLEGTNLLCGGTGNCQIFVFRRVNDRWISLFQGQAPICEGLYIRTRHFARHQEPDRRSQSKCRDNTSGRISVRRAILSD